MGTKIEVTIFFFNGLFNTLNVLKIKLFKFKIDNFVLIEILKLFINYIRVIMKFSLKIFLIFFLISFPNISNLSAQGFLHRQNKLIVNGSGQEILLKGIGLAAG